MPLIKPRTNRVRVVRHVCRLQEPNRDALVHYAQFIGDTVAYALDQLLASTLLKDRDFLMACRATGHLANRADGTRSRSGSRSRTDTHG